MEINMLLIGNIFVLLLMIIFSVTNNYSQPRLNIDEQVERFSKNLDLSEEQAGLVEEILIDSKGKADFFKDSGLDRTEMMLQMRDLMDAANKEIESILNAEQLIKFRELVEKRKEEMRGRRSPENKN
jgi:predicted lipid carrier protein YhbT